jgi:hypothetical protein
MINVLEIRNYLLKPHMLNHFIDNFEANFIHPLHALNSHVLGQFRLVGEPDHYVWLRGFEDMQTRLEALDGFYSGPVWQKHRTVTNGMILDNDNVHLLRPVGHVDLTCGLTFERLIEQLEAGTISTDVGVIGIDFYQAKMDKRDELVDAFQTHIAPAYEQEGIQIRGIFIAQMSENTYPRLPVIQIEDEVVVFTAYESEAAYREKRAKLAHHIEQTTKAMLNQTPESLLLSPTLRSPLRYMGR